MTLSRAQRRGIVGAALLALILIAIGLAATWFGSRYQLRLVYGAYVNLLVVLALQVFMGNARVTNLSHSAFMGIGAYAAAICVTPEKIKAISLPDAPWGLNAFALDPVSSALIALVLTGLVAWLVGVFIVRLTGIGATIVSLAVLVIVHGLFLYRTDIFKGNQAFFGIPQLFNLTWVVGLAVLVVFITRGFRESRWGVALRASADDEVGAAAMGVDIHRLRLMAWVLSGVLLAVAGIAYAYYLGTISARPFYFNHVFLTLAMLILGGMRTVTGAVLGTFLISFGLEWVRWLETGPVVLGIDLPEALGLSGIVLGGVIVLTMALRPGGLMGDREIEDLILK
ncbi:branched-chain amino acid ABC transporter permease [Ruegeria pomeroyi]|uniref:Branched-chain amino acid ABC transporter, permease protein n=2 Tax=Ruegeria pomeroyi TaxID=89184 RepID=Q5LSD5_RUEPO|nr:branched-chain amino acid ABC transporter permease [Ruegeria pomeroyi]HCE70570.1 branched-chain amino acid ABC transporter permease [Ruegeria sp.]AAV95112.1 branched-chain amino acid ABC transporter, permease protein [Ruegeria pomeroyi DSS-3]NVK99145.1 branched-chain amino acid ABC transporter permease [Ruegeria pomeroyi]NVL00809.1 branched-chain amino acid ABC transporter permease [Ruegeria pomeroyi]QWV08686.1 branched-chain amino acid ABC transporter permease [Ruegeria pomeroyi]